MKRLGTWLGLATAGLCALGCPGPHEGTADSGARDAGRTGLEDAGPSGDAGVFTDAGVSTGSLDLTVTGLPGLLASVEVTGPGSYLHDSLGSELLASLMLGTYAVTATSVRAPDVMADTIFDATPAVTTAVVSQDKTTAVTVPYSQRVGSGLFFVPSALTGVISAYDRATLLDGGINVAQPAKVTLTTLLPDGGVWVGPEVLALDPAGNLWAGFADESSGVEGLARFPAASLGTTAALQPDIVLSPSDAGAGLLTISFPKAMAFDSKGNLWIGNCGQTEGLLRIDKASLNASGAPSGTLWRGGAVNCPNGLAFDKKGNLWIASCGSVPTGIFEFTADQLASTTTPVPAVSIVSGSANSSCPQNLAFDAQGNLLVTECSGFRGVAEYPAWQLADGGSTGSSNDPTVLLKHANFTCPTGLAFDNASNLWVVDPVSKTVTGIPAAQVQSGGTIVPISSIKIPAVDYAGPVFDATPANLPLVH